MQAEVVTIDPNLLASTCVVPPCKQTKQWFVT